MNTINLEVCMKYVFKCGEWVCVLSGVAWAQLPTEYVGGAINVFNTGGVEVIVKHDWTIIKATCMAPSVPGEYYIKATLEQNAHGAAPKAHPRDWPSDHTEQIQVFTKEWDE